MRKMIKTLIIIALVTLASLNKANADWSLSYKGKLRTPLDLYTQEGSRLEKGNYNIEVECRQKCSLQLFQGDQVVANLEGTLSRGYQKRKTALMIPIVGTIFLQSSIKAGRSDAERRFSQTGRPQYVEETHDWQGSLRIFKTKSSNDGKVYIVFHEKGRSSRYRQVEFKLLSSKP